MAEALHPNMTFVEMLRAVRQNTGKTQADFAAALGYSPQYLCDLEQGRRTASVEFVEKLCKYMGRGPLGRLHWHIAGAESDGWDLSRLKHKPEEK